MFSIRYHAPPQAVDVQRQHCPEAQLTGRVEVPDGCAVVQPEGNQHGALPSGAEVANMPREVQSQGHCRQGHGLGHKPAVQAGVEAQSPADGTDTLGSGVGQKDNGGER